MWSNKDLVLSYEVATIRSMMNGYVKVGRIDDAQMMLKKMVDTSLPIRTSIKTGYVVKFGVLWIKLRLRGRY